VGPSADAAGAEVALVASTRPGRFVKARVGLCPGAAGGRCGWAAGAGPTAGVSGGGGAEFVTAARLVSGRDHPGSVGVVALAGEVYISSN